ncbi:hypothetical protein P9711_07835 [Anoxybacillus geothermalis]|nr:hypothetical protein [Anoxybacillus geothermalis]
MTIFLLKTGQSRPVFIWVSFITKSKKSLKESGKTIKITLRRASALPNELDYNRWRE